jgi:hypothetical protein
VSLLYELTQHIRFFQQIPAAMHLDLCNTMTCVTVDVGDGEALKSKDEDERGRERAFKQFDPNDPKFKAAQVRARRSTAPKKSAAHSQMNQRGDTFRAASGAGMSDLTLPSDSGGCDDSGEVAADGCKGAAAAAANSAAASTVSFNITGGVPIIVK